MFGSFEQAAIFWVAQVYHTIFLGAPAPTSPLTATELSSVQVLINASCSCTPAYQQHNTHQAPTHEDRTNGTFPARREYLQGYRAHSPGWGEWHWDKMGEAVSCTQSFDSLWESKSGPWAWSTSSLRDRALTSVLDLPPYAETSFPVSDSVWAPWFCLSVCI